MIIIECENDTALLSRMGFIPAQIEEYEVHTGGRTRVLQKVEQAQETVIGIIDRDLRAKLPSILRKYIILKDNTKSVKLMKRKDDGNKKLIMIYPNLEGWLYEIAKRKKIAPGRYKLPDDPKRLHDDGSEQTERNLQQFMIAIIKKKDEDIIKMKKWIQEVIQQ